MSEVLEELSKKYLDEDCQIDVDILIEEGKLDSAKAYIFGAIEHAWSCKEIGDDQYKKDVEALEMSDDLKEGLSPTRTRRIHKPE